LRFKILAYISQTAAGGVAPVAARGTLSWDMAKLGGGVYRVAFVVPANGD
jgi:hypothetical protein